MKIVPFYILVIVFLTSFINFDNGSDENSIISEWTKNELPVNSVTNKFRNPQTSITAQQQADSLIKYYSILMAGGSKQKYEKLFFDSFPSTFDRMNDLFGFESIGPNSNVTYINGPLEDYKVGEPILKCFANLTTIPKEEYYQKYTSICINGYWQVDLLVDAFGFGNKLLVDTKAACSGLAKRNDKEIKSIFRFIFDGPHPKNSRNEKIYHRLKQKISVEDKRLSRLLTESYKQLMAEDHSH